MQIKEICPTTTQEYLAKGALLVDVREDEEVENLAYDVEGLLHIPLSELEDRFHEIPKDKKVVMACRSGARSLRATGFLMNQGYDNVFNMQYGILRWVEKGFPVKGNAAAKGGGSDCCSSDNCC